MADVQEEGIEGASFLDGLISQETRRRTREQTQPLIDACCSPGCVRSTVLTVGIASLLLTTLLISISLTNTNTENKPVVNPNDPPYWMLEQVTEPQLRSHIKFLADDLLEGRGPGARGEALAASYIATHFRSAGLLPLPRLVPLPNSTSMTFDFNGTDSSNSNDDLYLHKVPLRGLLPQAGTSLSIASPTNARNFTLTTDYTADSDYSKSNVNINNARMVFVGYCITAKQFGIDNYEGLKVAGMIVVCLMNSTADTSGVFPVGPEYFGSWSSKLLGARALGAYGVITVHTESSTGYPWDVFQTRFGVGEQLALQTVEASPLAFKGWIHSQAADAIARMNGATLQSWITSANSLSFRGQYLTTNFTLNMNYQVRNFTAVQVVGFLGPLPDSYDSESVIMLAHHDSLGIRPNLSPPSTPSSNFNSTNSSSSSTNSTDSIYNGAVDNASGVSALIASAYALAALYKKPFIEHPNFEPPALSKTVLFISTTAEENMLGTTYLTQNPMCPIALCGAVSILSFDIMNVWGRSYDAIVLGKSMSSVMTQVADKAILAEYMSINNETNDEQGDVWPFISRGIPSVTFATGSDHDPNPIIDYLATRQYRPNDEYNNTMSMGGVVQQVRIALRIAYTIATGSTRPSIDNIDYVDVLW